MLNIDVHKVVNEYVQHNWNVKSMGRRNQLKMTGLSVSGRVERAEQKRLEQQEEARKQRLALLDFMLR